MLVEVIGSMAHSGFPVALSSAPLLVATLILSGCGNSAHPDDRMKVYNALNQNDLRSVTVSQDRNAGTMTLSGIVGSTDNKQKAEQLARQAAPEYSVVDRIQVDNTGLQGEVRAAQKNAQLDSAIESRYRATLASHRDLKNIQYSAYNGTLTLKGSVKNYKERKQAEDLAKRIPRVDHVVNEIQIRQGKPSPANYSGQ